MTDTRPPATLPFSRRLAVETPEHVMLEFELAGVGSRAAAAVVDAVVLVILFLLLFIVFGIGVGVVGAFDNWALAIFSALGFLLFWGYFMLFEALSGGRTPGKRYVGIRVVMDTGHPVSFAAAAVRNLVRIVDAQPGISYLVGLLFVFFHRHHKRLGDLLAGTVVVRDRPDELVPIAPDVDEPGLEVGPPRLSDEEYGLLEQYVDRLESLNPGVRARLATQLVSRFAERFPRRDPDPEAFLVKLYSEELARRRSRSAIRTTGGVARASGTAQRFVALRQAEWTRFRSRAAVLEKRGLTGLSGWEVREFAAEYREIAADLARARTYGVDARVLEYLERSVSAGHNVLYGLRGTRRTSMRRLLLRELPGSVVRCRRYVITAALLFALPAAVGYSLIRGQPELAYEILPHQMLERAESGVQQAARGRGYAQTPSLYLPIVASTIVANNVQVAFTAFGFGITAGVGTVIVLGFNGLFFGAVLGLFANYGLAGWLLTFVAGHGVLELSAIFIAGGAGLVVGRAIVAPGDLTRRDALVVHGRVALRMLGAAVSLLLLAGIIEGFMSASDAPAALKLGVSAASAALLVLYLQAGRAGEHGPWLEAASAAPGEGPEPAGSGAVG